MTHTNEIHSVITSAAERFRLPTESDISLIDHRDVIRAGMRRRARRKEMARESSWDSGGGAGERLTTRGPGGAGR
jgi:hypothetical protein